MSERAARSPVTGPALAVLGVVLLLAAWQAVAALRWFGTTVCAPTVVVRVFADASSRRVLLDGAGATMLEAVEGFGWALLAAVVVGVLATLLPFLRSGLDQLGTIESAIPFVAIAPILLALFSRDTVPTAMAATTAFFPLYLALVSGLAAVSPAVADLCAALGAARRDTLLRARIPAALPVLTIGMKTAIPLAVLGGVIGEWLGSSNGIGPIMLVAMRNYRMPMMWAAVVVTVVIALLLYGGCAALEWVTARRFG